MSTRGATTTATTAACSTRYWRERPVASRAAQEGRTGASNLCGPDDLAGRSQIRSSCSSSTCRPWSRPCFSPSPAASRRALGACRRCCALAPEPRQPVRLASRRAAALWLSGLGRLAQVVSHQGEPTTPQASSPTAVTYWYGPLSRWVHLPVAVVVLGAAWQYHRFAHDAGENCAPDCVTPGEIADWRAAFVVALALWIVALLAHFLRRRDGFR